jgi:hypothetical protein
MAQGELSIQSMARSTWIVAGLLLLAIGLGDVLVGRTKLAQYQEVIAQAPPVRPHDPAILFPKVTEADEQRSVARAKLGFYALLFLSGQLLTLSGLVLVVIGVVRLHRRGDPRLVSAESR